MTPQHKYFILILQVWYQGLHSDVAVRDPLQGLKHKRVGLFQITISLEVGGCQVDTRQLKDTQSLQCPWSFPHGLKMAAVGSSHHICILHLKCKM